MADLTFRKFLGDRRWGALVAGVFASVLLTPAAAHAATVSVAGISQVVPAGAQAAVDAAAQPAASVAPAAASVAPTAAVAEAARVVTAAASAVPAAAVVAAATAVPVPTPTAAPAVPHISVASVPATSAASAVPQVSVPSVPAAIRQAASSPIPEPVPGAPPGPSHQARPAPAQSATAPGSGGLRFVPGRGISQPTGARHALAGIAAGPRGAASLGWRPVVRLGAAPISVSRGMPLSSVHARVAEQGRAVASNRAPNRAGGLVEAIATAVPAPSTSLSLPPGGAGGPSAGGAGGATGGIAAAVLALAALALLRGFLPGLLALDVVPWRSALLAFRLERPG